MVSDIWGVFVVKTLKNLSITYWKVNLIIFIVKDGV
jgi:hypothetical protein